MIENISPNECKCQHDSASHHERMAYMGAIPQESELNFIKVGNVSLYDRDKKSALQYFKWSVLISQDCEE